MLSWLLLLSFLTGQREYIKQFFLFGLFLFLVVLGLCCCVGFSLVAANGGYSLVVVCGLLTVVASLVAEYRL